MHNIQLHHPSPQNFIAVTFCCFLLSQSISFILTSFYSPIGSKYRGSSFQHWHCRVAPHSTLYYYWIINPEFTGPVTCERISHKATSWVEDLCSCNRHCGQKDLLLGLMLCCHYLEILNNFWTRCLYFALSTTNYTDSAELTQIHSNF